MSEINQKIRNYFENTPAFIDNPFLLKDDDSVLELGLIDSFEIVELIAYIVENFEIEIDADDMEQKNFESINAIQAFVETKL